MSRSGFQRIGTMGVAAIAVVALVSGCSSKAKSTATAGSTSSTSSTSSAASAAAVATDSASPTKVVATGGGNFCKQVAQSMNATSASTGSDTTTIKQDVQQYQALRTVVLKSAPGAIKGDLTTLFGALDTMYAALTAANYDYTKLDPKVMTALEDPKVATAEQHVNDYIKNTCGIDTGADTSEAPAAAASASAALASALAKLTASAAPSS